MSAEMIIANEVLLFVILQHLIAMNVGTMMLSSRGKGQSSLLLTSAYTAL